MKLLKKILDQLDRVKVIIKFARAFDAAIDAFKAVVEASEDKSNEEVQK